MALGCSTAVRVRAHAESWSYGTTLRLLFKIIIFTTGFSLVFFLLHTHPDYQEFLAVDLKDLGGVPWLYSIVGMIFSILAAFVIQTEWDHWSQLVGAMKDEVSALDQLWHWSHHFPEETKQTIHRQLRQYLVLAVEECRRMSVGEDGNEAAESTLASIRDALVQLPQKRELMNMGASFLSDTVRCRRDRLNYRSRRLPRVLRATLVFTTGLVITLSLFIGVRNIWLDYLFTMSIALLAFLVYLVIDDLDNPLRPGMWHVAPNDYQQLLRKMSRNSTDDLDRREQLSSRNAP